MLRPRFVAAFTAIMLGLGPAATASHAAGLTGLGLDVLPADADVAVGALPSAGDGEPAPLLRLRVVVPAAAAETEDTAGRLSSAVALAAPRARVVVALSESALVDVRDGADVDTWVEHVATIVERCAGRVAAWEIGGGAQARSAEEQAFFLKRTALAVKGVDRRALVLGADPRALPGGELSDQVGPFLDGFALPPGPAVPAVVLRVHGDASDAAALWDAIVASKEAGEDAATFVVAQGALQSDASGVRSVLETAARAFPEDVAPTGNAAPVSFPDEARIRAAELIAAGDLSSRVTYRTELSGRLPAGAVLATFQDEPKGLVVFDPLQPEPSRPRVARRGRGWAAEVPLASRPLVLSWERGRSGDDVEEKVAIATTVDPTVEEVLARHFAVQAARDRKLHSYTADLSTEMRYELGSSGQAFEVRIEGTYFFHESGVREIENRRYFINGARYEPKHGRAPEIPLLQPETVQVLPLEVRLDRSYEYRLLGRDVRAGRACWKVAFKPLTEQESAYAGTTWIDAETWDRVAVDLVQTRLQSPVLTNEQTDTFGPVLGGDGEHWLVQESLIHRTVSLLGGTVGVQMRLLFSNFRVNDEGFAEAHAAALASTNQMLRETDEGLKYLRSTEGGGREIGETSSRKIFVAAGARYDGSYGGVLPLAGVNWLDYDLAGRGLQLNIFAAGAINTVSFADPSLFGSRVTLGMDAIIPFIRRKDRLAVPGAGVDDGANVRARIPRVDVEVSPPVGRHGRAAITMGVAHESWSEDDDTDDAFVVPADNWLASLGAKGEIHRKGWDARFWAARSERQDWEPWGLDTGSGPPPLDGDAGFWKWGANLAKTWPLGRLQTTGFDAQYIGGSGLDRFSQHEFAAFGGTRLPGFDGSGIHFDEAALLRLSWGFDVAGVFGAQVQVGVGRTWNGSLPAAVQDAFGEDSDHAGIALTGTVPGPWSTIVRFDVGTALYSSDYEDAEGNVVAQVVVLKLLGR